MTARHRTAALLFLASVGFQLSFIFLDAFLSDEGIVLLAADDLAKGKILYRDFYTPVTPAVYLLQGIAFKLFGSSFVVSRLLICSVYAACVVCVFAIATQLVPLRWARAAGALAIPLQLWMWPHAHYFSYNALAIFFCLLAIQRALRLEAEPRRQRNAHLLGLALAAGLFSKPNLALATGGGILAHWFFAWLRTAAGLRVTRARGVGELWREGVGVMLGVALGSTPFVVYLAATGTLDEMFAGLLALARVYADVPGGLFPTLLPFTAQIDALRVNPDLVVPGMIGNALASNRAYLELLDFSGWVDLGIRFIYYAPLALLLAVALSLGNSLRRRSWTAEHEAALLTLLASAFLFATIAPHPALHYLTPTLLPALALAAFLARSGTRHPLRLLSRAAAVASLAVGAAYLAGSLAALHTYVSQPRDPVVTQRGTLWVEPGTAHAWNAILEHARYEVAASEQIFAVPHFPLFYFLAGREHPTPYVDLRPGSPGVDAENAIIRQLEQNRVEWVLRLTGSQFQRLERFEFAYPRLHRYITNHYEVQRSVEDRYGVYAHFMRRKPRGQRNLRMSSTSAGG